MKKSILILFLLCAASAAWGIGNAQLGFTIGLNPDPNGFVSDILPDAGDNSSGSQRFLGSRKDNQEFYNLLIQNAVDEGAATGSVSEYPLGVSAGLDFRYVINSVFMRIAIDYTQMVAGRKASLKAGSNDDSITYTAWNTSFPITFGVSQSLSDFFHFYLGAGPYYAWAYSSVSHTAPAAFEQTTLGASSPYLPYRVATIQGHVLGYHILVGVEVPIVENRLYLSLDYTRYDARSGRLTLTGVDTDGSALNDTTGDTITLIGNKFTLGIFYHFRI